MDNKIHLRRDKALNIVRDAALTAANFFKDIDKLVIEVKGKQDLVSDADRSVETQIRSALLHEFPDDGIIGEEHGRVESGSGYTWVIDPIDGTSSFVAGMPGWCVVLACVYQDAVVLGVIIDPIADETFVSVKGEGATLNGRSLSVSTSTSLARGSTAVGYNAKSSKQTTVAVISEIIEAGGIYYRCGSGALMLCYVAAGRLIGYCEPQMNAWDCMAALHIIEEAGGLIEPYDMSRMLTTGGKVITACPGVFPLIKDICERNYS